MILLLMIFLIWDYVVVDNVIEMRWCWCREWHWDEMILMLRMTLRWDDVNVDNDIEMSCCWCWNAIVMMCDVYVHRGVVTMLDIPGGRNRVIKEFWASLEGDVLEPLIIHG